MPTIYREGPYRFFFNSREETRIHVHVESPDGNAKFWLEPVALAKNRRFRQHELKRIERLVRRHQPQLLEAWHDYFGA